MYKVNEESAVDNSTADSAFSDRLYMTWNTG